MRPEYNELDKRLLGLLIDRPGRVLQLALATGMAIGQELTRRGRSAELDKLGENESLCMSACAVVLEQWVECSRAGHMTEADFTAVIDKIERIARAS